MIMNKNTDSDAVKLSGLRITKCRSAILDVLEQSEQPISAEQIFLELKEKNVTANLSTVYRTLDVLEEKNLATKLSITGDNRALYEFNRMVHRHYLVCLGCKKIIAINSCPLEDYEKRLAKETDYLISGHRLDIYGYCPECRRKD
jgi:Fur family ferric uptake transcriptional regulator